MADQFKLGAIKEKDGSYSGVCSCGYRTLYWPQRKIAADRIRQHGQEHRDGTPMQALSEFRTDHGLLTRGMRAVLPDEATAVQMEDDE